MVSRTTDGEVEPGSGLATLQTRGRSQRALVDQLRPLLVELVGTFGENAAVSIDDGDALVYLAQVASDQPVSVQDVTGERHGFHVVAPGLVSMAAWPDDRLDRYLAEPLLEATEASVTDPEQIRARLRAVRVDGWAWTDQELDHGVNGLACPVLDRGGNLVATVSLFGPSYRFSPSACPNHGGDLQAMVLDRSESLLR